MLNDREQEVYSRQILLSGIGIEGQEKLKEAKVLLVGAGGLGSPTAIYLAAAGIGTLGIIDGDQVSLSNLHRQILYDEGDISKDKAETAGNILKKRYNTRVIPYNYPLTKDNALGLFREYDVIVNGSDNFPTRYLANDAAVLTGKPLVDASILGFQGQATTYIPGNGCYRCLFPEPPEPGAIPTCSDAGVIGPIAGHLGTLQALETIKLILEIGETLANRLLLIDGLYGDYQTVEWERDPNCSVCGDNPSIRKLIDYDEFCTTRTPSDWEITNSQVDALLRTGQYRILDIRSNWEVKRHKIPDAVHIPLSNLEQQIGMLDRYFRYIVVCTSGNKSIVATMILRDHGYEAFNLKNGLRAR